MLDAPSALALASSSMGAFAGLSIQTENRRVCPGGLINIRTLKSQLESAEGERTDAAEAEIGATARLRALSAAKAELIGFIVWLS